jgi:hypothetical protein
MYESLCTYLKNKYNRWQQLNEMVSSTYKSKIMITLVSIYMIFQYQLENIMHSLNNNVKKIDKHRYEITYIINNRTYKMIVKVPKGPVDITNVKANDVDITKEILPYYGCTPEINLTPNFYGYNKLTFEYINGDIKDFEDNEVIII